MKKQHPKNGEDLMFKRVMMAGLISISVLLMLMSEAKAQNIWNVQFFWGTITCDSFLNGISKKAAPGMLVKCEVVVEEVSFTCRNPAGKPDQSSSHLFRPKTVGPLTALEPVESCTPEKDTGKWNCEQEISNAQIQDAIKQDPSFPCPSRNSTVTFDAVTQMIGNVTLLSCNNPTTGCSVEDTFFAECSLPPGEILYNCTERR
jgi:hypothetical protein